MILAPLLIAQALPAAKTPPSPADLVAKAPASDWRPIADDALLVFTLDDGRRIIVQLAPEQAPAHVARIRQLARAHWWDATSIYRVQDNYVAQWGDRSETKPLPAGIVDKGPAEYQRAPAPMALRLKAPDSYARLTGFTASGWPAASDGQHLWATHCYGAVGVGRDLAPSVGNGAELYAVIGHAPRALDRNIALVGRVVAGIEYLSSLPRGTGKLGFYDKGQRATPIASARLASELPAAERPRFEYLSPASASFAAYVRAKENREPPFFTVPADGADVCAVPVPVRARAKP